MSEPNEILAEKSAAEEASSVERCLTFESGGLTLFLSTNYVTEIINDCSITHLPLVPGHVKGILNLRGQILRLWTSVSVWENHLWNTPVKRVSLC